MKIAIAGYGVEGEENYRYFSNLGHDVTIVDEKTIPARPIPEGAKTLLGEGVFSRLNGFGMVVRTAGLAPRKIVTDGKIWSASNEFFAKCPAPIIGVTGTKGKGTTASLITSILRAAGRDVHLVGNIGTPALEALSRVVADDIVVYELSSFQLWDLEKSPHIAVVLMIEADHLNVHEGMDDYVKAKGNIAAYQTADDVVIFNRNNIFSNQIAVLSLGRKIEYPFAIDEFVSSLRLPGKHNQENAAAAIAAAREFGASSNEIKRGLEVFDGLPHRLELVREFEGVMYYNDSFSSAPSATVAAIKSFTRPEIIIIGGTDKGADFTELRSTLLIAENIKKVILIGEIRHKLAGILQDTNYDVSDAQTMSGIVHEARSYAAKGDVVILSPACASFDMFKSFYDRGDQFREVVTAL